MIKKIFWLILVSLNFMTCSREDDPCLRTSVIPTDVVGWKMETTNNPGLYPAFYLFSRDSGITTNGGKALSYTDDGGKGWSGDVHLFMGPDRYKATVMTFVDREYGWVGLDSIVSNPYQQRPVKLMFTPYGGRCWKKIDLPLKAGFKHLHFSTRERGCALLRRPGRNDELVFTKDGGMTWASKGMIAYGALWQVKSRDTIYVNDGEKIKRTTNGGETWPTYLTVRDLKEFHFLSDQLFFIVQDSLKLYKYRIGQPRQLICQEPTHIVHIVNEQEMLVIRKPFDCNNNQPSLDMNEGVRNLCSTSDGGKTWSGSTNCTLLELAEYHFFFPNLGFAVYPSSGKLYRIQKQ